MTMSVVQEIGEELLLFIEAKNQSEPGEDWAIIFAKALAGATPDSFAEALQRMTAYFRYFLKEDMKLGARNARLISEGFKDAARSEHSRLRIAADATSAGSA